MARPQSVTDHQILEAALACFLEHGPSVATEIIAQKLHVSPQALLKRFGSKHELMLAALKPAPLQSTVSLLQSGPDNRPVQEQLTELLSQVAVFFIEVARRMQVLRWSGLDCRSLMKEDEEPLPLLDIRVLAAWLEQAAGRGLLRRCDFRGTAMLLLSSLHGPTMLTDLLGKHPTGHSTEEYVSILVDTVLNGLTLTHVATSLE